MQSLIPNTDNVIMGGDWNCILTPSDSSRPENTSISQTLKGIINSFRFRDIISAKKSKPEYTYYHNDYAARLDRMYVSKLFTHIVSTATKSAYFSDHLSVSVEINISTTMQIGRPQRKLNVSVTKDELIH